MTKLLMLTFAIALVAGAADAKSCKDPTTGKFIKCPPAAASTTTSATTTTTTTTASTNGKAPPHCTKGKPCGNACIKATETCHKN